MFFVFNSWLNNVWLCNVLILVEFFFKFGWLGNEGGVDKLLFVDFNGLF